LITFWVLLDYFIGNKQLGTECCLAHDFMRAPQLYTYFKW